jgi:hypothetical protein
MESNAEKGMMHLCSPDRIKVAMAACPARRYVTQSYWLCRGILGHMVISVVIDWIEDVQASKVQEVGAGGQTFLCFDGGLRFVVFACEDSHLDRLPCRT